METYGYKSTNNLVAENVELKKEHGALGIKYHVSGLLDFDVEVNVPGKFSVYNSLTAIAICHHFNVDKKAIGEALHHAVSYTHLDVYKRQQRSHSSGCQ